MFSVDEERDGCAGCCLCIPRSSTASERRRSRKMLGQRFSRLDVPFLVASSGDNVDLITTRVGCASTRDDLSRRCPFVDGEAAR
jgi:hypothetical protein